MDFAPHFDAAFGFNIYIKLALFVPMAVMCVPVDDDNVNLFLKVETKKVRKLEMARFGKIVYAESALQIGLNVFNH